MEALQDMLHRYNPYAIQFKHAQERMRQDNSAVRLKITAVQGPSNNHRRYNRPTASEVVAILPGVEGNVDATGSRDLILEYWDGGLKRVSECHSAYLPLRYTLLFPWGE